MACALENTVGAAQGHPLAIRTLEEAVPTLLVVFVTYWLFRGLFGWFLRGRATALAWVFWVFLAIAVVGILVFSLNAPMEPEPNLESITAIGVAWAAGASIRGDDRLPIRPRPGTALVSLFAVISATGLLVAPTIHWISISTLPIVVSAFIYSFLAGCVAWGARHGRRWTTPLFYAWVASSLLTIVAIGCETREWEKATVFTLAWLAVVTLLRRALQSTLQHRRS